MEQIACYAASKGAVANLTRQVAMDYAEDGIHCNAICPGCKSLLFYMGHGVFSSDISSH